MENVKKSYLDYLTEEEYARFNELLDMATAAKADAPKAPRKPRGPMTKEQKTIAAQNRLAKAQAALDALLAAEE